MPNTGNNTTKTFDWREVRTGKDGTLYLKTDAGEFPIVECDTFRMWMSYTNVDFQPVGSYVNYAIPTGHTVHVSMTETVVRDDLMLDEIKDTLSKGTPEFVFVGNLKKSENISGSSQQKPSRVECTGCIPDGEIDLFNITPGETIKRAWTFRSNANPEISNPEEI